MKRKFPLVVLAALALSTVLGGCYVYRYERPPHMRYADTWQHHHRWVPPAYQVR
jgi:hypothetical protein